MLTMNKGDSKEIPLSEFYLKGLKMIALGIAFQSPRKSVLPQSNYATNTMIKGTVALTFHLPTAQFQSKNPLWIKYDSHFWPYKSQ